MEIIRHGAKWIIKGDGESWPFDREFSRKWKAELALKIFKDGGNKKDYWKAAKEDKPIRTSRIYDRIALARRKYPDGVKIKSDENVVVSRNIGSGSIEIKVASLSDFHVRNISGGINISFAYDMLCARMLCTDIPEGARFGHSCSHGQDQRAS
jgi:hypothetical protein